MTIWLVMQAGNGQERTFPLDKPRTLIGREPACNVRIPIPSVSHRHCQITLNGNELTLQDLNSERGTYHNGARVEQATLTHQDVLTIGPVTFVIRFQDHSHHGPDGEAATDVVIERMPDDLSAEHPNEVL